MILVRLIEIVSNMLKLFLIMFYSFGGFTLAGVLTWWSYLDPVDYSMRLH